MIKQQAPRQYQNKLYYRFLYPQSVLHIDFKTSGLFNKDLYIGWNGTANPKKIHMLIIVLLFLFL